MANSLIVCRGESLWVGDSLLEVVLFYFTKLLKEKLSKKEEIAEFNIEWFEEYYDDLMCYLKGFSSGGIDFELEEVLADENRLSVFESILKEVRNLITQKGKEISIKELNVIENMKPGEKSYWQNELETQLVIDVIDKVQFMLKLPNNTD